MYADVIRYLYENCENLLEILKAYLDTKCFINVYDNFHHMSVAF